MTLLAKLKNLIDKTPEAPKPFNIGDETPILSIAMSPDADGLLKGKLVYVSARETIVFSLLLSSSDPSGFSYLSFSRLRTGESLAIYQDGRWRWSTSQDVLADAVELLSSYALSTRPTE